MDAVRKPVPDSATAVQFLDDQPASTDLLNYQQYAIALSRVIGNEGTRTPFIIGVLGRWGSGKTTLMRLLEAELAKQKITTVWFSAWQYSQADEIWAAFLQALSQRLLKQLALGDKLRFSARLLEGGIAWSRLIYEAPKFLLRIALVAVPVVAGTLFQDHVGPWLGSLLSSAGVTGSVLLGAWYMLRPAAEALRKDAMPEFSLLKAMDFEKRISLLDGFREQFGRMLDALPGQKRRIVLFVDDIDRCSPDKVLQLLDAVKVFLDIEGCIFVLGLDIAVIQQALAAKYPADLIAQREYIAKIIQLPFQLPPLTADDLTSYLRSLQVRFPDERCLDVFLSTLARNPREIKRVINTYSLVWSLAQTAESGLKPVRVAKVVALQQAFDPLFRQLRDQPEWLGILERAIRAAVGTPVPPSDESVAEVTLIGSIGEAGVPPAISAFVSDPVLQRMLTMHPLLDDNDDANFCNLSSAELALYFTLTKRLSLTASRIEPGSEPALSASLNDTDEVTSLFDGRYVLGRLLGQGGTGTVYAAEDRTLGRQVVIKRLAATLAEDPEWRRRFSREMELLPRINNHPNLTAIYSTGVARDAAGRDEPYIVMEFVSGETLRDILNREKILSWEQVKTILRPLLDALEYVHGVGIIHRDIKPTNIIVGQDRRVRLVDFGLAIESASGQDDLTVIGTMIGTPRYMSPEQLTGEPVDGRSDLYTFGLVLFESITGRPPLPTSLQDRLGELGGCVPRASKFRPDSPASLDDVIARLLALNPDDRFADARSAKAALDAALPHQ